MSARRAGSADGIGTTLDGDYVAEFGYAERASWDALTSGFRDANLYQTWPYDAVRSSRRGVVHMMLRRGDAVVAAAQVRIVRVPGTRTGIAYVRWGPMWRSTASADDGDVFRRAVRALRNELSRARGLVVRLYPLAHRGRDEALAHILEEEGYRFHERGKRDRTLVIDLEPSLAELRTLLDQKWRNCLNRAEKNGLALTSGEDDRLFDAMERLHGEMAARKGLLAASDIGHLRAVQRHLPEGRKLRVILCRLGSEVCAGAIFAAVGTAGLYVRGATSDTGLKTQGSYMVQWAFVQWLKEHGFLTYDLNGVNPEGNPGTYHFKRGLAGKRGRDVEFLGTFQVADRALSDWVVTAGERLVAGYRWMIGTARSLRGAPSRAA